MDFTMRRVVGRLCRVWRGERVWGCPNPQRRTEVLGGRKKENCGECHSTLMESLSETRDTTVLDTEQ